VSELFLLIEVLYIREGLKRNPEAKGEMLQWKRNASVKAKYSFIPTQEKTLKIYKIYLKLLIFATGGLTF
jgi:hypothetical protein